jgi:NTE family protein
MFAPASSAARTVLAWGLVGVLAGCATSNRYDSLRAVPLDQVEPAVATRAADHPQRLGIAFGGGGVRGFMHLGVLRALDEAGIRAEVVTGSSVGAIAAALYASGMDYAEIERRVLAVSELDLADIVISRQGALNGRVLAKWIRDETGYSQIRDLPLPLGIAVTDLGKGQALLVVEGDLGEAVQTSASVPGVVVPVQSGGATYVDGGVLTIVPVRFARALGADMVIGIDIYCGHDAALKHHAVDTVLKTFRLQSCRLSEHESAEADFLIRPAFEPASATSFAQSDEAVMAGYRAARAVLPALKARLATGQGRPQRGAVTTIPDAP